MSLTRDPLPQVDRSAGPDGCWPWLGPITSKGYGRFNTGGRYLQAHRVVYKLLAGDVLDELVMDHLCRNRLCCNPAHLEPVTPKENVHRSPIWNGNRALCKRGHPLSGANLYVNSKGERHCRECGRQLARARYAKRRAPAAAVPAGGEAVDRG